MNRSLTHNSILIGTACFVLLTLALLLLIGPILTPGKSGPGQLQRSNNTGVSTHESNLPQPVPTYSPPAMPRVTPEVTIQTTPDTEVVHEADFGTWRYVAKRSGANLEARVYYDHLTLEGLRAFAAANRTLADQLVSSSGNVQVELTFKNYMIPNDFRAWARAVGARVEYVTLRAVQADGMRATISIKAQSTDVLPQASLDEELAAIGRSSGGTPELDGVFHASTKISPTQLSAITSDPLVFLPDVTPDFIRTDLAKAGISGAEQAVVRVAPPIWEMEDIGLENFR